MFVQMWKNATYKEERTLLGELLHALVGLVASLGADDAVKLTLQEGDESRGLLLGGLSGLLEGLLQGSLLLLQGALQGVLVVLHGLLQGVLLLLNGHLLLLGGHLVYRSGLTGMFDVG